MAETIKREIPFSAPPAGVEPPPEHKLTEQEQTKYDEVLNHFETLEGVLTKEKAQTTSPLTSREKAWLSRECFLRYLRATKWDVNHAIKRLEATLVWRRTFGVDFDGSLAPDVVSEENETGKNVLLGFDNNARPCLYLKPGRQNTKPSHRQVQHLVYSLERAINFMVGDQDSLALLIDFQPSKVGISSKLPSLSTGREVLSILQDHYPERLGKALLTNIPRLASIFLKLIHPFIDPMTREKLVFEKPFPDFVPAQQLEAEFGGSVDFEYKHQVYWPALTEMAEARVKHYYARHEELGGGIGVSETEMRKGFVPENID